MKHRISLIVAVIAIGLLATAITSCGTAEGTTATATKAPAATATVGGTTNQPTAPTATPTARTSATTPAVTPTKVASSGPPKVTHSVEGRADCLMCHASGVAGANKLPDNHAGRPVSTCLACHKNG